MFLLERGQKNSSKYYTTVIQPGYTSLQRLWSQVFVLILGADTFL